MVKVLIRAFISDGVRRPVPITTRRLRSRSGRLLAASNTPRTRALTRDVEGVLRNCAPAPFEFSTSCSLDQVANHRPERHCHQHAGWKAFHGHPEVIAFHQVQLEWRKFSATAGISMIYHRIPGQHGTPAGKSVPAGPGRYPRSRQKSHHRRIRSCRPSHAGTTRRRHWERGSHHSCQVKVSNNGSDAGCHATCRQGRWQLPGNRSDPDRPNCRYGWQPFLRLAGLQQGRLSSASQSRSTRVSLLRVTMYFPRETARPALFPPGKTGINGKGDHLHPWVGILQQLKRTIAGTVIYDNRFKISKALAMQAVQAGRKEFRAVPVYDDDRYER